MTAVKIESIYTGTKEVLTSFVGELVGPTVGLDDGCSEDREQKISCVSKCDVEVCILKKSRDRFRYQPKRLLHITYTLPAWKAIPLAPPLD